MADTERTSTPTNGAAASANGKEVEKEIAKENRMGGAEVFQFDPNSTPEEKMAQAKKVCLRNHLPPARTTEKEVTC